MPTVERIRHELRARLLTVKAVEELTPSVRRITLEGDLTGFTSASPDDHVKLFFAAAGETVPNMPTFNEGTRVPAEGPPPQARDFTPRKFDVDKGELVIDFVLHGAGPASSWAAAAEPGSVVGQGGPRGSMVVSDDFDWYLLAGDESALPAIGRRLEELPGSAKAFVIAEVADERERIELSSDAELNQVWLYRTNRAEASRSGILDLIRDLQRPSGVGFIWAAGEADEMRPLREHLRDTLKLPKEFTKVTGYWRRSVADHHDPR